jgi:uncharacterized protein YicC (UPF0701 family)
MNRRGTAHARRTGRRTNERTRTPHPIRGTEDNVRDELDEAAQRGKAGRDASKEAVEEEESTGGVKGNVKDEWDESQEH